MSTRARLTLSYALVLLGTMVAFAISLWTARRNQSHGELAREAFFAADRVLLAIQTARLETEPKRQLTVIDTVGDRPVIRATRSLGELLDPLPGYFMVLDQQGKSLYTSTLMRSLSSDDQATLLKQMLELKDENIAPIVPVRGDLKLLVVARRNVAVGPNISRVVSALPTDLSELAPQLLVGTMVVLAPIIFVISIIVAYLVVGNAFRPIDRLINEVEAITDGRSLHRRLATDASNDELSRLGLTVN